MFLLCSLVRYELNAVNEGGTWLCATKVEPQLAPRVTRTCAVTHLEHMLALDLTAVTLVFVDSDQLGFLVP